MMYLLRRFIQKRKMVWPKKVYAFVGSSVKKFLSSNTATWNYRVLRHEYVSGDGDTEEYLAVHEVHYENDNPIGCTKEPIDLGSENLEGLRWQLEKIKEGLDKPVLDYEKFEDGKGYTG